MNQSVLLYRVLASSQNTFLLSGLSTLTWMNVWIHYESIKHESIKESLPMQASRWSYVLSSAPGAGSSDLLVVVRSTTYYYPTTGLVFGADCKRKNATDEWQVRNLSIYYLYYFACNGDVTCYHAVRLVGSWHVCHLLASFLNSLQSKVQAEECVCVRDPCWAHDGQKKLTDSVRVCVGGQWCANCSGHKTSVQHHGWQQCWQCMPHAACNRLLNFENIKATIYWRKQASKHVYLLTLCLYLLMGMMTNIRICSDVDVSIACRWWCWSKKSSFRFSHDACARHAALAIAMTIQFDCFFLSFFVFTEEFGTLFFVLAKRQAS